MAKTELGIKRICLSCGMRFYDFKRRPIVCPGCGKEFDSENLTKSKKSREIKKVKIKEVLPDTGDDFGGASISDGNGHEKLNVDPDEEVDLDGENVDDPNESSIIGDDLSDGNPLLPLLDTKEE